ncbi:MAG: hypothetical protein OEU50_24055, partial [Gammaproteobacteria bacterium]|nr:hypothetical protein [Gammaproteobacteria bacterium]
MLTSQRNGVAEHAEFERVTTDGGTGKFHLGAFHEAKDHQPLHVGIRTIYVLNHVLTAALER